MKQEVYMNRELSWLKFNERVLEEAENEHVPLAERLSFEAIYQSNLDEFFMVRVGSLLDQMLLSGDVRENKTNMTPKEQIHQILKVVRKLNQRKDAVYETLMDKLEETGVSMVDFQRLSIEESAYLEVFFDSEILPLLSPTIVGKRQPFPFLKNRDIYAVCVLQTKSGKEKLGIVPCSKEVFPELIELPTKRRFMLVEELILHFLPKVFAGYKILSKSLMRITRNADIDADALYDEDLDYREFMVELIKKRRKLAPLRLEPHAQIHQPLHAVPRIAHQRVHQQGVALIVTAGKRLGVVPFDRVVVGNRLLRAVVDCIQRAASEDGIAADLAHLFQHQHLGAELIRPYSRRQTSAAAANDHDFRLDGDVLRLFDDSLHLRRPLHGVQTRLGHSVQHSRHDGIGGLGRARNRVNVRGLLLDDETRNLRHSRIRNAGGVAILGHFDGGHCAVVIHGHSHFNGALATDFAVARARKDAGLRTRSAAQRQQHRQRQQERKELLHGSPPYSFGRNGRRSICRIFYYTIPQRWLARGNDAFFTSKIGDFCKKKGFRQEFRGLRANCVLGKSKSGIAPGGKEELSDG